MNMSEEHKNNDDDVEKQQYTDVFQILPSGIIIRYIIPYFCNQAPSLVDNVPKDFRMLNDTMSFVNFFWKTKREFLFEEDELQKHCHKLLLDKKYGGMFLKGGTLLKGCKECTMTLHDAKVLVETCNVATLECEESGKTATYFLGHDGNDEIANYLISQGGSEDDFKKGKISRFIEDSPMDVQMVVIDIDKIIEAEKERLATMTEEQWSDFGLFSWIQFLKFTFASWPVCSKILKEKYQLTDASIEMTKSKAKETICKKDGGEKEGPQNPPKLTPEELKKLNYILYFHVSGSLESRNKVCRHLRQFGFGEIDCTGGQAAFEDGDFNKFQFEVRTFCKQNDIGIKFICRCEDFGLGLMISNRRIDAQLYHNAMTLPKGAKLLPPPTPFPFDYYSIVLPDDIIQTEITKEEAELNAKLLVLKEKEYEF